MQEFQLFTDRPRSTCILRFRDPATYGICDSLSRTDTGFLALLPFRYRLHLIVPSSAMQRREMR
jgi:hypothetical protein